MKNLIILLLFIITTNVAVAQDYIRGVDLVRVINSIEKTNNFGDDEFSIVIVEIWADFNKANAFKDWETLKGITHYYRCDIASAPELKKKYRIRMAPTLLVFRNGVLEESYKAGLDLTCPVTLTELQTTIDELKIASKF